ncbi:hypothetical protein BH10ACI1_BH10ACI1_26400 [soil metagenome]
MICQNCQTNVDNDLIFCTNCGERISGTINEPKTALINDSVVTQNASVNAPKSSSNLKWFALIVALIAIPASIFGVYLLMNPNEKPIVQNTTKPNSPAQKTTQNQNTNLDSFHKNVNADNANANQSNANTNTPAKEIEIINERIEIDAKSSYAKSFTIKTETAKIIGDVEVLQGETVKGFVYLQTQYDDHFPDENYKMFSFGDAKKSTVDATLVKENYVLVFANDSDKSIIIKSKMWIK